MSIPISCSVKEDEVDLASRKTSVPISSLLDSSLSEIRDEERQDREDKASTRPTQPL